MSAAPSLLTGEVVLDARARLGEGPVWDARREVLWWVDILNHRVHRFTPATGEDTCFDVGEVVGCAAPAADGTLLLGLRHHLATLDPTTGRVERRIGVETDRASNRINDGRCDARGRFWFGTMSSEDGAASLYRYDPDGTLQRMESGLTVSNGLGWSPDGATFYLTDSPTRIIYAYDFAMETGNISGRRDFARVPEGSFPDGLAVDVDGGVWSAQWDGRGVIRFGPDGAETHRIALPVQHATSCAFGGPDRTDLYVTSASVGLSQEEIEEYFHSGDLFRVRMQVPGLPYFRFGETASAGG